MRTSRIKAAPRLLCIGVALFSALAFVGPVHAQDAKAKAEALNTEGRKLVTQLDLEGAAERFRQALQLEADPRYAFNLCYTLEKSRKFIEAWQACKQVEGAKDERLASKAAQLLTEIEEEIAAQQREQPLPPVENPQEPPAEQPPIQNPTVTYPAANTQPALAMPYQRTETYGWQIILADVASLSVLGLSSASDSSEMTGIGVGGLIFGAATVHALHGNRRGAWISVSARVGLPLIGILAFGGTCEDDSFGCVGLAVLGGTLGFSGAAMLDWFWLSETTELVYPKNPALVQPTLRLTQDGAIAGVSLRL